jgi:hypothetical protein
MRNKFIGYYVPSEPEFKVLWQDCFFSFDANVLLNFYRYRADTRNQLFGVLEALGDRIWLTNQAAREYFENRLGLIQGQIDAYAEIARSLDDAKAKLANKITEVLRRSSIDVGDLMSRLDKTHEDVSAAVDKIKHGHPDFLKQDDVLAKLTTLFEGRVGDPYSADDLANVLKLAEERLRKRVPPGFEDADKGAERQYGDTILWFQLLAEAKRRQRSVIFVTDDAKDDWWLRNSGKTFGPRPELIAEARDTAGVAFYMYPADRFITFAARYLGTVANKEAIEDIKEAQKRAEEARARASEVLNLMTQEVRRRRVLKQAEEQLRARILELQDGPADAHVDELRMLSDKLAAVILAQESTDQRIEELKLIQPIISSKSDIEDIVKSLRAATALFVPATKAP